MIGGLRKGNTRQRGSSEEMCRGEGGSQNSNVQSVTDSKSRLWPRASGVRLKEWRASRQTRFYLLGDGLVGRFTTERFQGHQDENGVKIRIVLRSLKYRDSENLGQVNQLCSKTSAFIHRGISFWFNSDNKLWRLIGPKIKHILKKLMSPKIQMLIW